MSKKIDAEGKNVEGKNIKWKNVECKKCRINEK